MRSALLALTVAAALGAVIATLWPSGSAAVNTYILKFQPPTLTKGSRSILTCGWHDSACPSSGSNGLDWDDEDTGAGHTVYFRARGISPDATTTFRAYGILSFADNTFGNCKAITVQFYHSVPGPDPYIGKMLYIHVGDPLRSSLSIYFRNTGYFNNVSIGKTLAVSDDPDCASGGTHTMTFHMKNGGVGSWFTNTTHFPWKSTYPDYCYLGGSGYSTCNHGGSGHQNDSSSEWSRQAVWGGP